MPPIPPMPPPIPPMPPAGLLLRQLGDQSVSRKHQACHRSSMLQGIAGNLGGIQNAHLDHVAIFTCCGVVPKVAVAFQDFIDDYRRLVTAIRHDLAQGLFQCSQNNLDARILIGLSPLMPATAARVRNSATPPPGTIPSSTAARVACKASSTRAFFSFISTSVAAPTLINATPPASLATRSCNFSLS